MNNIARFLPSHMRMLSDPQMMRTMFNRAIIRAGGEDRLVAIAGESSENFLKVAALAQRAAPKEVAVSGSIGIESYIDHIDAAERAGIVIDGDYVPVLEKKEEDYVPLFMWPDCFHIDTDPVPA